MPLSTKYLRLYCKRLWEIVEAAVAIRWIWAKACLRALLPKPFLCTRLYYRLSSLQKKAAIPLPGVETHVNRIGQQPVMICHFILLILLDKSYTVYSVGTLNRYRDRTLCHRKADSRWIFSTHTPEVHHLETTRHAVRKPHPSDKYSPC
jgi:hypothetical protein